jgi:hypothetical protein
LVVVDGKALSNPFRQVFYKIMDLVEALEDYLFFF